MSRSNDQPKTLIEASEFYLHDCLIKGLSPRTIEGKQSALKAFVEWCAGETVTLIDEIDLAVVEGYQAFLFQYRQPFNDRPLEKSTIRNRLTHVKRLLAALFRRSFIEENVAALIDLPKVPRRLPSDYLKIDEVEKVIAQPALTGVRGIRDRVILETYYSTAIRRMELANLDIGDVDFDKLVVTIRGGKGGRDRRTPLAPRSAEWVDLYLKCSRPDLLSYESGNSLFIDNAGRRFRANQLTAMVSKYVKRAGIERRGACNLLRHAAATHMHENGAGLRNLQEFLGHADISTTQVYTHVTINGLRTVYSHTHPAAVI